MSMLLSTYNDMLLSLSLGNYRSKVSLSKPLFVLSIIDLVEKECLAENKILSDSIELIDTFTDLYNQYNDNKNGYRASSFLNPFFHLNSSDFYHLVWKKGVTPPSMASTPSAKYFRENLLYAKLDDELWELLQDPDNREYLRTKIIKNYLSKE